MEDLNLKFLMNPMIRMAVRESPWVRGVGQNRVGEPQKNELP
jgi:hypothetical protein